MRLFTKKITVDRAGYVKNEDELEDLREEAERIVNHYLKMMEEELDQAGYEVR